MGFYALFVSLCYKCKYFFVWALICLSLQPTVRLVSVLSCQCLLPEPLVKGYGKAGRRLGSRALLVPYNASYSVSHSWRMGVAHSLSSADTHLKMKLAQRSIVNEVTKCHAEVTTHHGAQLLQPRFTVTFIFHSVSPGSCFSILYVLWFLTIHFSSYYS